MESLRVRKHWESLNQVLQDAETTWKNCEQVEQIELVLSVLCVCVVLLLTALFGKRHFCVPKSLSTSKAK